MKDIDFALVEEKRPPLYTAMKYWGKKPHNIWGDYIRTYTPDQGLYLDPFAGSAMSAFEAVRSGRKAIAFDLNPLTAFLIETYSGDFNKHKFKTKTHQIIDIMKQDETYIHYFSTWCEKCKATAVVQHCKWEDGTVNEVGVDCQNCVPHRYITPPKKEDLKKSKSMHNIDINYWYPCDVFHKSPSFSANFISRIGGNRFCYLWTRRNLYVLSKIFDEIINTKDQNIKKPLLLGFIKTLHLCTKMSVPRREGANRAFSTSWGRSTYLCASRQMEMNPLLVFKGSCLGKQSVESAFASLKKYLGKRPKILYVDKSNKSHRSKNFEIKYGIVDINTILNFLDEGSIDFILTDPPYGGLVQYLDLSAIWLIWLKKIDRRYTPSFQNEITVKGKDMNDYNLKFQKAARNLYKVLKQNGKIVFTFHNKDLKVWNAFLKAIRLAGFKIEKVIHQPNRRTGESNVANPYGTSGTDFYIRCVKNLTQEVSHCISSEEQEFRQRVIQTAIDLIAQRNEPTPYQILFNGILSEISSAGFNIEDFDTNIQKILEQKVDSVFKITSKKDNGAGKYWWFQKPSDHIKYPDRDLNDRLEWTISTFLRNKQSVSFDDVLAKIFTKYPNGLTPEVTSISTILKKYAYQTHSLWCYKGVETEQIFTEHTKMLMFLSYIGKKMGFTIYIGKAEQSDKYQDKKLSEYADLTDLKGFGFPIKVKERVEMIDMLWIKNKTIEYAIEVENSTKFTSGLQRASNLGRKTKKIMVLPDERKNEFLSIQDPLFKEAFKAYNWKYMFYSGVSRLKSSGSINKKLLNMFLNEVSL